MIEMRVLLVNGSPNKNGTTNRALEEVDKALRENGIETEMFWIGISPIAGCIGCSKCFKSKRCIYNDVVNEFLEKVDNADGFVFGAPVHFAGVNGSMNSFMDRVFYGKGNLFKGKVAAGVVCCRRAGTIGAFDRLNKYFTYSCMPIVSSNYWNGVFGFNALDAEKDLEGLQTMRVFGNNMAWLLKCIELGKKNGIEFPKMEKKTLTNYID